MLTRSALPWAVLLLGRKVSMDGSLSIEPGKYYFRFPLDHLGPPGLVKKIDPAVSVKAQLVSRAEEFCGRKSLVKSLNFVENYSDKIDWQRSAMDVVGLYVASWHGIVTEDEVKGWATMPEILRSLPQGKVRLSYLRAFQVMQGGMTQDIEAVDTGAKKKSKKKTKAHLEEE